VIVDVSKKIIDNVSGKYHIALFLPCSRPPLLFFKIEAYCPSAIPSNVSFRDHGLRERSCASILIPPLYFHYVYSCITRL
jgi:hypothetical protein